jgi:membrane protein DedA with SNARE-associated domain
VITPATRRQISKDHDAVLGFLPDFPIEQFVAQYGYWAVFLVIGLESAGLPLPGEITLVTAAVIAGTSGSLDISLVLAAAVAGAVLGDNAGYWIGREFGFRLLMSHGAKVGIRERQLKLGQFLFLRHGGKVVFFGRMVAVLRVLAALLAGINRMPWPHFCACNVAGGVLWAMIFGGGAYLLGQQITQITGPAGVSALMAGVVMTLIGLRYIRHHQRALEEQAELALPGPLEVHHHIHRGGV